MKSLNRKFVVATVVGSTTMTACTGQLKNSFRFAQINDKFGISQSVNTKVDLLWVVDNSASMDTAQAKLRAGFSAFAQKYMKPTWDIRVAVIPSDMYMANPAFSTYLNTTIPGTTGWKSNYIFSRIGTFVNPSWNTSLVNTATGVFTNGIKYKELVPGWQGNYSKLVSGTHDGPTTALCSELMPYFLNGATHCSTRDNQNGNTGTANCLSPNTGSGESSETQCVNTIENDTVHSGKAIISTMPPTGTAGDAAWTNQLINDFMINVTTGSSGSGSERGLGSVLQLLSDNETTSTAFFRAGSVRGIIFVSDEEDQTMVLPSPAPAGFSPMSWYRCDQAGLTALNGANLISGQNGYCCSDVTKNCSYGSEGTSCDAKTIDGYTYTVSICPRTDKLMAVADVKTQLDSFFKTLDGNSAGDPNYFVASIVASTGAAIQSMQAARNQDDTNAGALRTVAVDRADRYIELGNLVGGGSMVLNIADSDYSTLLDSIGRAIVEKRGTFTLTRAPGAMEYLTIVVEHLDGTTASLQSSQFTINGTTLTITDVDFLLGLASTDKISLNYQPKSVF